MENKILQAFTETESKIEEAILSIRKLEALKKDIYKKADEYENQAITYNKLYLEEEKKGDNSNNELLNKYNELLWENNKLSKYYKDILDNAENIYNTLYDLFNDCSYGSNEIVQIKEILTRINNIDSLK